MKTKFILTLLTMLLFVLTVTAQQGINYKAIIKDNNGDVIASTAITIQFTILENTTSVYSETHNPTTDANGIVVVNIGEGTVINGDFNTIDWGSNPHFLNTQIDTGNGLTDMGTTEFKTVPYALVAKTTGSINDSSPCDELQTLIYSLYQELYTSIIKSGAYTSLLDPPVVSITGLSIVNGTPPISISLTWTYADPIFRELLSDVYFQTPSSSITFSNLLDSNLIVKDIEFEPGMYHWQVVMKDYFNNITIGPVVTFILE